jgi:calcium-dependent protein kinase
MIRGGSFVGENKKPFNSEYVSGELLGEGAFGRVIKCTHRASGDERAAKFILRETVGQAEFDQLMSEIEVVRNLSHPNIVRAYEYFLDKMYIIIVTELCRGGEVLDYLIDQSSLTES